MRENDELENLFKRFELSGEPLVSIICPGTNLPVCLSVTPGTNFISPFFNVIT